MTQADERILLLGHGTVDDLDDIPPFLTNIRRGRPSPPALVHEVRRRYELIGGSPLLRISQELAAKLEQKVEQRVHLAMRFWRPFAPDVLREISSSGCTSLRVLPLAPFSGQVYGGEMQRLADAQAASGVASPVLRCAPDWGSEPLLIGAFADALLTTLREIPASRRALAHVFFTAHSLPLAIVEKGDRYPDEVKATAFAVADQAAIVNPHRLVFQSQGATADPWLGPNVRDSLTAAAGEGAKDVVFCPIGFLGDHVEILYDLDIEAKAWAREAGLGFFRTPSLNSRAPLVAALAEVAARL